MGKSIRRTCQRDPPDSRAPRLVPRNFDPVTPLPRIVTLSHSLDTLANRCSQSFSVRGRLQSVQSNGYTRNFGRVPQLASPVLYSPGEGGLLPSSKLDSGFARWYVPRFRNRLRGFHGALQDTPFKPP